MDPSLGLTNEQTDEAIIDPVFGSINDRLQPLPTVTNGDRYEDGRPSWENSTPGQTIVGEILLQAGGGVRSEGAFKLTTGHGQFFVEVSAPTPQVIPGTSRVSPVRVQKDTIVQIGFTTMRAGTSDRSSSKRQFRVKSGERKRFPISLPCGHDTVGGTIFSVPGTMRLTNVSIYI